MPASAREPCGTFVLVLCGQPEQKYGCRFTASAGVRQQLRHGEVDDEMAPVERRVQARQPFGDRRHHARRAQLAQRRQQRRHAVRCGLSGDARSLCIRQRIQQVPDLPLDHRRLLLDDEDLFEPLRELEQARRLERIDQPDLVDAHARGGERVRVQLQPPQHLHEVVVRLADGDDAERRVRARDDVLVDRVHAREGSHRIELCCEPRFESERRQIDRTHVQRLGRREVDRQREVERHRIQIDRHARLDHFGDRLEADPAPEKRDSAQP